MNLLKTTTSWHIGGTKTFRLGSKSLFKRDDFKGYGTNLQNRAPIESRIYVPSKSGYVFLQADQAGAEALRVAYLARPAKFRELFIHNIKPHVYIGLSFPNHWRSMFPDISFDKLRKTEIKDLKSLSEWKPLSQAIKDSDGNPPRTRYYYVYKQACHCVDSQTEVLTENGWINVANFNGEVPIAVSDKNRNIHFEIPLQWNKFDYTGPMISFTGKQVDQCVTPDHKMLYKTYKDTDIGQAKYLKHFKSLRIPTSGNYESRYSDLSKEDVQLLVAIQAYANIQSSGQCRFHLFKSRKIERLEMLCSKLNIRTTKKYDYSNGSFFIVLYDIEKYISILTPDKVYGAWLLQLSRPLLNYLIEELSFWDGTYIESFRHKREDYCSKHHRNVDWIKTALHLCDKQGTIIQQDSVWEVGISNRQFSRVQSITEYNYTGQVYCPTTSTGFFLIRRYGKISITGNSGNYGVEANAFQLNTLKKSEGSIYLSLSESAAYIESYHTLFPEIREWQKEVRQLVDTTRTIRNAFGYPRYFGGPVTDKMYKEAYAQDPQSTIGTITNIAYTQLQRFIEDSGCWWNLLVNKHDSILMELPEEEAEIGGRILQSALEQDMVGRDGVKFRMKTELAIGRNWGKYHETKNPEGMKEWILPALMAA